MFTIMNLDTRKNASLRRTKLKNERPTRSPQDWHPVDILAAVYKTGITLAALSRAHGYSESAAGVALYKPWPALERIIASRIGRAPRDIWPSRYDANGEPKRLRKRSTRRRGTHVQTPAGAHT